ncbi:hypothetical protein CEXT_405951 [Caerostris extrusa]|uniref:Uncharacterized protein n=1 Tax=Caerostris extrusa TaxID=172846 RepID=A0AAV4TIV9_CAEEX|nr:hypothetical protein CEXT_405951 [Caerostris extrusa]
MFTTYFILKVRRVTSGIFIGVKSHIMAEFKIVRDMRSGDDKGEVGLLDIWEFEKHFNIYSIYSSPGSKPDFHFSTFQGAPFLSAKWEVFESLLDKELDPSCLDFDQNIERHYKTIAHRIIWCARKVIPRGKIAKYKSNRIMYLATLLLIFSSIRWSINLMEVKSRSDKFRRRAELSGSSLDVQAWRRQTAVFKKSLCRKKFPF